MTCDEMLEQMSAALDGELTAEEKSQLDRHLAQCDHCRALFEDLSAIHEGCACLEVAPPPALRAQILGNLPPRKRSAKVITLHWQRWAAMAASFALVVLAAWHLPRLADRPPEAASTFESMPAEDSAEPAAPESAPSAGKEAPTPAPSTGGAVVSDDIAPDVPDAKASPAALLPDEVLEAPVNANAALASPSASADNGTTEQSATTDDAGYGYDTFKVAGYSGTFRGPVDAAEGAATEADEVAFASEPLITENTARKAASVAPVELPLAGERAPESDLYAFTALDADIEVPEPHPEVAPEELLVKATLFKAENQLPSVNYCGVLTLKSSGSLLDYSPDAVLEDGAVCYTLPKDAFDALFKELEAGGFAVELRTTGDDISASAEAGRVVIFPAD